MKTESSNRYIEIDGNTITIHVQDGPIKEAGVNGCQVDDIIGLCHDMLDNLNSVVPCMENRNAILALDDAMSWLRIRKIDREWRGVEGTSGA